MKRPLYKCPKESNKFSGNVTLSHEELEQVKSGEFSSIRIEGFNFDFTKTIQPWMIENAVDLGDCILFPYSEKSFLVKSIHNT